MKGLILILLSGIVLAGCNAVPVYTDPESVSYTIEGETTNEEEAEAAVKVVEDNLTYAQEEDMDGYLSTIVSEAHEETKAELAPVFEKYDLEHTVLSVEILEQEADRMLIRAEQQTIMTASLEGEEPYRDHIAEANHTMVKENGEWKIQETIMTDTLFLD